MISCNAANPVWLYPADRRGWGRDCSLLGKVDLDNLRSDGAQFLISRSNDSGGLAPTDTLANYLRAFHQVVRDDESVFMARLTWPREAHDLPWETVFHEDFSHERVKQGWSFGSGDWEIVDETLLGEGHPNAARATLVEPAIECGICRFQIELAILPPSKVDTPSRRRSPKDNAGKYQPKTTIRIWEQETRTGIVVTLETPDNTIRFQQLENGDSRRSTLVEHPLELGRSYALEVRFDLYDFELLLDGESILIEPSRLSTPLKGTFRLQSRAAGVAVNQFEMLELAGTPTPAR